MARAPTHPTRLLASRSSKQNSTTLSTNPLADLLTVACLEGATGACTHSPPERSFTTVMRTVVETLMPASDCMRSAATAAQLRFCLSMHSLQLAVVLHRLAVGVFATTTSCNRSLTRVSHNPLHARVCAGSKARLLLLKGPYHVRHSLHKRRLCIRPLLLNNFQHVHPWAFRQLQTSSPRSVQSGGQRAAPEGTGSLETQKALLKPRQTLLCPLLQQTAVLPVTLR